MRNRFLFKINCFLLLSVFWLASCVKEDISLKDLDGTIGFNGAVVLPVAKSTITFKDFINYLDPQYISEDATNRFVLKYTPTSGLDFNVKLSPVDVLLPNTSISLNGFSGSLTQADFNAALQSQIGFIEVDLTSINSQHIIQLDSMVTTSFSVDLTLHMSDVDFGSNMVKVVLTPDPACFVGAQATYESKKTVSELTNSNVFSMSFKNVRLKPVNNKIKFTIQLQAFNGGGVVLGSKPALGYEVAVKNLQYQVAFGQFSFDQPSQTSSIDISDLNQFLNADSYLPYAEPKLSLDVTTNARLPLAVKLDYLRSANSSSPVQYIYASFGGARNALFPLLKVPAVVGAEVSNSIVLSKEQDQGQLDQLFAQRGIRALDYSSGVSTVSGITNQFILNETKFKVVPTVQIPLSFGPGAEIAIKDTVSMDESIRTFFDDNDIDKIGVLLTISNSTSAAMVLGLTLQDAAYKPISAERTVNVAASTDADQFISLPFSASELKSARYMLLNYKMKAKDVQSTLTIKSTDFLKASVGVYLKGKVTF